MLRGHIQRMRPRFFLEKYKNDEFWFDVFAIFAANRDDNVLLALVQVGDGIAVWNGR